MSFLNPIFLIALAAVGLPLVIHLLNLRKPKKIRFSTLSFFKELQKTTIRKIRIKRLLLLLIRFLAIACLALVLARPFLPPSLSIGGEGNQPAIYAILIDNSISMNRIGSNGPLIDQAKEIAEKIVSSSKEQDRFVIQTTNGEEINSSVISSGQLSSRLSSVSVEKKGSFLSERLGNLFSILEESPFQNKKFYVIGDDVTMVSKVMSEEFEEQINTIPVTMLKTESVNVQNTFIADVSSPSSMIGQGIPFMVEVNVRNSSDIIAANQFLTLQVEDQTVGQYPLQINPEETQSFSFEINPDRQGAITGKAIIEGDGFSEDNEYFFSILIPDSRNILWVTKESDNPNEISYTRAILDAQGTENQLVYKEVNINNLSNENISDYDALLIDQLDEIPEYLFSNIQQFVQNGKGVVLYPSPTADISNYNEFLSLFNAGRIIGISGDYTSFNSVAKGSVILEDHPVFAGLFEREESEQLTYTVPDIYYYLRMQPSNSGLGFNVMELNNGDPLLREKKFGEGRLLFYTIGNDPGWSNFPVKALFPPTNYRSILYAASLERGGLENSILGQTFEWQGTTDPVSTELVYNEESIQVNPRNFGGRIALDYQGYDWQPGWVTIKDDSDEYKVALNLGMQESVFDAEINEIAENLNIVETGSLNSQQLNSEIRTSGFGKEIWQWFMLAGLLLLITETLVATFYKAETVN